MGSRRRLQPLWVELPSGHICQETKIKCQNSKILGPTWPTRLARSQVASLLLNRRHGQRRPSPNALHDRPTSDQKRPVGPTWQTTWVCRSQRGRSSLRILPRPHPQLVQPYHNQKRPSRRPHPRPVVLGPAFWVMSQRHRHHELHQGGLRAIVHAVLEVNQLPMTGRVLVRRPTTGVNSPSPRMKTNRGCRDLGVVDDVEGVVAVETDAIVKRQ